LILVAGPVNTPEWTRRSRGDEAIDLIRALYPISFFSQNSARLKLGRFGGRQPFPLAFTREGRAAEFLKLGASTPDERSAWDRFEGVFGYYAVNEPKAGAEILAHFADPATAVDDRLPIYLASQFYGAGRVLFQASGEMWRIRNLQVDYFREYYNQLIRWTSQGRMIRDSSRGVLLTDRDECWVGDSVLVQAILRDAQNEPLVTPNVNAVFSRPDGSSEPILLSAMADAVRPGMFVYEFTAAQVGTYKIRLPLPDAPELEVLNTSVVASIPDRERQQPKRNDRLLQELADQTGGRYYIGMEQFDVNGNRPDSPVIAIPSNDQVSYLMGTANYLFQRKLMIWLMTVFALTLSLEWIVRRLNRLA
jgi:hypothetical protein